jgi:hypothetical protein
MSSIWVIVTLKTYIQTIIEDTEEVIRICNSKDRQHNGQKKKRTNNALQITTQKTKDRATQTQLKTGGELMC